MNALVIAEHSEFAAKLSAKARELADSITVVVVGEETVADGIADAAYHVTVPAGCAADDADCAIAPLSEKADVVFAEPTRRMKSVIGKLAARKGAAVISDAMAFDQAAATSMYFGGVGQAKREPLGAAFYTVSPSALSDAQASGSNAGAEELEWVAPANAIRVASSRIVEKTGVDLTKSDVVIAAGRGFAEEGQLELARELADKTGAGLGCTRPLAEGVNWMPKEAYIGVSGLMLSPKVYVGVGVSGQMQHMVGVNRAKAVFAINKDENAPIFKQCDYGLVGDIKDVLPALVAAL